MSPTNQLLRTTILAALAFTPAQYAATITVAKSGADFTTISEAVKAAKQGDVIKIMDLATYEEQVTIDSAKYSITLTSKDPASLNKPVIKYQDKINIGPKTYAESQIDSLITFDRNGALRIIGARNIIIDGIAVDGGGVYAFGFPSVWENRNGLQHGNAAITLWQAGNVIIRNCDISNAYFGISVKDRNVEGIFSIPNPSDLDTTTFVPSLKFGMTGNHLIERNRIHNNSWGMFFESMWDLGSTIRYNLLFENHHPTATIAAKVRDLTSDEGPFQPGGAFLFKDNMLSPLAIYNNTLYHNFTLFAGHWRAGYHLLVFNNIFGPPHQYLQSSIPQFRNSIMELFPVIVNRVYNCIFSAQVQAPQQNTVNILDSMTALPGTGGLLPDPGTIFGGSGIKGFPASAANRWLEMIDSAFLSINPASEQFLEPDWDNDYIKQYIIMQGWEKSGVKNTDGSRADLGAIEKARGTPSFMATIQPGPLPIMVSGTNAQITFSLNERAGTTLVDPAIKLFRLVKLNFDQNSFGAITKSMIISGINMTDLAAPAAPPVKLGPNTYSLTTTITNEFAFIEMIIEATGANGKHFTTPAGFLPYRKLDYTFKVEIADKTTKTALTETHVGDTVLLKISPQKINGDAFPNRINTVRLTMQSGDRLLTPGNPPQSVDFPIGVTGPIEKPVMFTKIPENGHECISVAGIWFDTATHRGSLFFGGTSIMVLPQGTSRVADRSPLAFKQTNILSNEMTITCFDLQGRRIFQKTFFTDNGPTVMLRYLQTKLPGTASKIYLMDISVKDRVSLKQTRRVRKLMAR